MSTQTDVHREQRLERSAQRVMDSLDRQDERLNQHYSVQRKHQRHEVRTTAVVVLPPMPAVDFANNSAASPVAAVEAERLSVWVRNVSPTGMSFIYPQELQHKRVVVGLNPSPAATTWFHAEVMRVRKVIDGFWEYGVAFKERATL